MRITKTYFSFALPYSYERYLNMVRDLPESNEEIQVSKEVLCYSNNLNLVYVLTITSKSKFLDADERVCENSNGIILPEKHLHPPRKYCDKPVILISSRVHPGETTSSWAVEGIIKFIIGNSDDAKALRKHFQIVIVPMLNPDGVE
jgi:murein tripeptide amidase MpaA